MSNSSSPNATSISRAAWLSLAAVLLAGCNNQAFETKLDTGFKQLFAPRKTPQQYMLVAVSSEDPDARRDAVVQVSKSKLYDRDWAIKGFVAIALLESEPQTRCVAIRALARTGDPRAVETALKILDYNDYPPQEVWPPVALCRWDATVALADLSAAGKIPAEYRPQVYKALLDRLHSDPERHARIAAARGLAYYPDEETVKALIEGLRDADFAVAHQCEDALVLLTGRTHDANALAWEEWLAANRGEIFAHAGEIPQSRQLPYHNGLEKSWYDTKELILWLWPGSKEEQ
jgi:HEAT repeat protein